MAAALANTSHQVRCENEYRRAFAYIPAIDYAIVDWQIDGDPDGHTDSRELVIECLRVNKPVMIRTTTSLTTYYPILYEGVMAELKSAKFLDLIGAPEVTNSKGENLVNDLEKFIAEMSRKRSTPEYE